MAINKRKTLAIALKDSVPSPAEQKIIDGLPAKFQLRLFNGRFVENTSNEKIKADHLLNLSGRKEVDEWYDAVLYKLEPTPVKEPKTAAPKAAPAKATTKKSTK